MLKPGLRKLDRFLAREDHGDDVMLLSEFDGFIAGIVVCPDLVMPSDWLHAVWGEDGPVFESEREANDILSLIMTTLHAARHALTGSIEPSAISSKPVGRNDPCPCGSGKKFKKCCLN